MSSLTGRYSCGNRMYWGNNFRQVLGKLYSQRNTPRSKLVDPCRRRARSHAAKAFIDRACPALSALVEPLAWLSLPIYADLFGLQHGSS